MTSSDITDPSSLIEMTVDVVSAYIASNSISAADLPQFIASTHAALTGLVIPAPAPEPEKQQPAVSIKKSVTDDYLISLEDGKRYKSLKRHLGGRGLSPDQYRTKWGLPSTYPMVAPAYAKKRSELARASGLGRKRVEPEPAPAPVPTKRGRPKKA
jgi:predicted transcriptional regulator